MVKAKIKPNAKSPVNKERRVPEIGAEASPANTTTKKILSPTLITKGALRGANKLNNVEDTVMSKALVPPDHHSDDSGEYKGSKRNYSTGEGTTLDGTPPAGEATTPITTTEVITILGDKAASSTGAPHEMVQQSTTTYKKITSRVKTVTVSVIKQSRPPSTGGLQLDHAIGDSSFDMYSNSYQTNKSIMLRGGSSYMCPLGRAEGPSRNSSGQGRASVRLVDADATARNGLLAGRMRPTEWSSLVNTYRSSSVSAPPVIAEVAPPPQGGRNAHTGSFKNSEEEKKKSKFRYTTLVKAMLRLPGP